VRGSLGGGKYADLVVLSEDLFRIPRRRIAEVEAVLTIVGGHAVYTSPGLVATEMRARLLEL
jgi:predicted amidohydrolase YtcJ